MNTRLETLLNNIPDEGNSLKYTFGNSFDKVTFVMLATDLYRDNSEDYSLYLLRVVGFEGIEGIYTLHTSLVQGEFTNYRIFDSSCGDVSDTTLEVILDTLKDAREVHLNGYEVDDWEDFKELCFIEED